MIKMQCDCTNCDYGIQDALKEKYELEQKLKKIKAIVNQNINCNCWDICFHQPYGDFKKIGEIIDE